MTNNPELKEYLAELVLAGLEERAPAPLPGSLSVRQLVVMAHEMQMTYLLLSPLLRLPLGDADRRVVQNRVLASALRSRTQQHAIEEIERLFEEAGIRHQFLKGAVLKDVYPKPECRDMSDIDIMVYGDGFEKASRLLAAHGYELDKSISHHEVFTKGPLLCIELHWALYDESVDGQQAEYYQSFTGYKPKEGYEYACAFSREDFYVYMVSHIARHFYSRGCGIRNLVDIFLYCGAYPEETVSDYVARELANCGLASFEESIRTLAFAWLGKGEQRDYFDTFFSYMCSSGIYGREENGIWSKIAQYHNVDADSFGRRLRRWYYFPPLAYMEEDYPWLARRPWLLPWAWVVRAVAGLAKKGGQPRWRLLKVADEEEIRAMQQLYSRLNLDFHQRKSRRPKAAARNK